MRRVKMAVFAGLLTLLWFAPAQAAPSWFIAEVIAAGPTSGGQLVVRMTDTAETPVFTKKWFVVPTTSPVKMILATALTAVALDLTVWVFTDGVLAAPEVFNMYVRK